jgi:hypothetical protein
MLQVMQLYIVPLQVWQTEVQAVQTPFKDARVPPEGQPVWQLPL